MLLLFFSVIMLVGVCFFYVGLEGATRPLILLVVIIAFVATPRPFL